MELHADNMTSNLFAGSGRCQRGEPELYFFQVLKEDLPQ